MLDLHFRLAPVPAEENAVAVDPTSLDGESVQEALLARGTTTLRLVWLGYGPAILFAEDDAMFLVDSWKEAEELVAGTLDEHLTFLGDGHIDVVTRRTGPDAVLLACRYCPHLNRGFLRTENVSMSLAEYRSAWRALLAPLLALAGLPDPSRE